MNDKTLTVGELISQLEQFNHEASIYMCVNGHVTCVDDNCMSWYGGDDTNEETRNINEEKLNAEQVFIYLENTDKEYDRK